MEILQAVQEAGEKAVVFSYLLQPLDVLARRLAREHPLLRGGDADGRTRQSLRGSVYFGISNLMRGLLPYYALVEWEAKG